MVLASMVHFPTNPIVTSGIVDGSWGTAQIRCYRSNRSRRGLYDGKDIRSGNNVSFSMRATKRKFRPNVIMKRVYSEILDEMLRFHLTTSTLRSIDKAGGLDNYLLTKEITEGEGFHAKQRILKRLKNEARMRRMASEAMANGIASAEGIAEGNSSSS
jgi:large subunit ribosomal protein L28